MDESHAKAVNDTIGPVACRGCDLFEVCSLIDALPISSGLQRCPTLRTIARGDALYRAGAPAQHVYAIRKGIVKSATPMPNGTLRAIALHVPGEVLGRESITGGRYAHDVIALTPTMVCELPLKPYLRSDEALAPVRAGFEQLGRPKRASSGRLKGRVRERLLTFIEDLKARLESHGIGADGLALELRKRELAELLGAHAQTLGRVIDEMQPDGSVRLRGHYVLLQNVA